MLIGQKKKYYLEIERMILYSFWLGQEDHSLLWKRWKNMNGAGHHRFHLVDILRNTY